MASSTNSVRKNVIASDQTSTESKKVAEQGPEATARKTFQVFSEAKSRDSDDELTGVSDELAIFTRQASIPPEFTTISCRDQNIKGSELIEMVHNSIKNWYDLAINLACEEERDIGGAIVSPPDVKKGILSIEMPKDWVMSLGGWKGMMPSEEVQKYFLGRSKSEKFTGVQIFDSEVFPLIDGRIHLPKGFSINQVDITGSWKPHGNKWALIPGKTDLSYSQIVEAIKTIKKYFKKYFKKDFNLDDPKIASLQLWALNRETDWPIWFTEIPRKNQKEILNFLDYLNGLMFGVEASGLNAALAISLMTLDLIAHGRLDYSTAFKANNDGGIYPYACFGNNRGTYTARESILLHSKKSCDPLSMKAFRENPSLSPVAIKEAILIKKWLKHRNVLQEEFTHAEQIEKIDLAIKDVISSHFAPWLGR